MKIIADNNLKALKYDPDGNLGSAKAETVSIAVTENQTKIVS